MGLKVTNNAFGTLNAGISSGDTVIVLEAGQGARFPVLSAGDYFYATLIDTSNQLEIVKVTVRATDTMTVVRAQDGTSSRAYNVNDRFELRPTAALFNEKANADELDADALVTGTVPDARISATLAPDKAFRRGNILGTVSQSGGVPTGAIIERGSNANGEFVKYADGTLIATKIVTFSGLSLTPNGGALRVDHLMAASFVGSPVFSYNGEMLDSGGNHCYGYFISGFGGVRSIFANTGYRPVNVNPQWNTVGSFTATNGLYTVMAIGRWF